MGSMSLRCWALRIHRSALTASLANRAHSARYVGFILIALLLASNPAAGAASDARIADTQPSASSTLGRNESFYVRIEYATDEPLMLWARPYLDGKPVEKAMSNASSKYTGSGEALGWFALIEPGDVDEVRIIAGGGQPYREWELAREPVQLRWTAASAPAGHPPAAWVDEQKAADEARNREEAQRRASEPVSGGEVALFNGFMLLMLALLLAGIGVPLWSVWKWRGGWRIAAAVPAAVVAFVVLRIIVATARDPTSHNLWPFEILMFGTLALVIIGVLKVARRFLGADGAEA